MITILKKPSTQYFARNFLLITANNDDNHILTAEKLASITLLFGSTGPAAGQDFYLGITGEPTLMLTSVAYSASPPAPGTFRVKDAGQTLAQWAEETFVEDVKLSNLFSSFWTITYEGGLVVITRKAAGSFNYTNFLSNCIVGDNRTNNGATLRSNYKLRAEIFLEDAYRSNNYELINTLEQFPDAEGNVQFDVAPSVLAYLKHDMPPEMTWSIAQHCQKRYWVRLLEYYGDTPQSYYSSTAKTEILFALRGGVPAQLFNPDYSLAPVQDVNTSKWLTWLPNHKKKITIRDREYLAFRYDDTDIQNVQCKIYYSDGSFDDFNPYDFVEVTPKLGDIVILPTGYEALGIADVINESKTLVKYEVLLADGAESQLYKAFTYEIDHKEYDHRLTLLFQNGLGVPEPLHVTQAIDRKLNVEKEQAEVYTGPDFDFSQNAELIDCENQTDKEFTVNTGSMPQAYILQLEDMLRSKAPLFMLQDDAWVPLQIYPGSFEQGNDNDDLYSLTFTFRLGLRELNYGDKSVLDTIIPNEESGSGS